MTGESTVLLKLMELEQWRAVHQRTCDMRKEINDARIEALTESVERGFNGPNGVNVRMDKFDNKLDRITDWGIRLGAAVLIVAISGLGWYTTRDLNKLHNLTSSENVASVKPYRGKP